VGIPRGASTWCGRSGWGLPMVSPISNGNSGDEMLLGGRAKKTAPRNNVALGMCFAGGSRLSE
jgi:hypothetical protein